MPDFQKALQSLKAADLAYIRRITESASDAGIPDKAARKRRSGSGTGDVAGARDKPRRSGESRPGPSPSAPNMGERNRTGTDRESRSAPAVRPPPGATGPDTAGPDRIERAVAVRDQTGPDQTRQPAPFPDAVKNETVGSDAAPPVTDPKADEAGTAAAKARTRRTVPHEWPPVGTMLKADYFGVVYRAEVIAATKRLKAGKQLRLLDGPAKGRRLDSFSKAMLVATVKQRREQKLGRRGASSGWEFWRVESPSS